MRQCNEFFERMRDLKLALTYDEVTLTTSHSEVLPKDINIESWFSRRTPLKIPITSAAMDNVTESRLAIELSKLGGMGVIHKNLSPDQQRDEVQRVKFHLSGFIEKPITVKEDMTLGGIENMRKERGFSFHSFPVLNASGKLVGIITQNDFDFCKDYSQKVSEVMTRHPITAPPRTSIKKADKLMRDAKKKVLPLIDKKGCLVGMYLFSDVSRIISGRSDMYNVDEQGRLRVAAAVGVGEEALERTSLLHDHVDVIVIDTAHGDSGNVCRTLKEIKRNYDIDVVAGNISEGKSAKNLADWGADGIKVGQGPGSICTTRVVSGIGCPQITAIDSVVSAIEGSGIPVCADGGIKYSGDIPKAIGAGAYSVMLGKLLAGTKEAPGEVDYSFKIPMKFYRGMGSLSAMQEKRGSRERYLQGDQSLEKLVPEGIESMVPFIGDLAGVIHQLLGGLRSGMGYVGAASIFEMRQKADFHRLTGAGQKESHPHDVEIIRDAPNYSRRQLL